MVTDLRSIAAGFALVGGLAVSIRAEPRLTRDVDVAISVSDDEEAQAVVTALSAKEYRPETVIEHDISSRLAAVRLTHTRRPELIIDLLFASCGIEEEIVEEAEDIEVLPGLHAPVARTGHLLAMKLLARDDRKRPTDADDLRMLAAHASNDDWSTARSAVELIEARGYSRNRDLADALSEIRRDR